MKTELANYLNDEAEKTKAVQRHTPTPWMDSAVSGFDDCKVYQQPRNGTQPLRVCTARTNADAEFIIRAANSHDALIEALEACVDELSVNYDLVNDEGAEDSDALNKARVALMLAKDKS